MSKKKVVTYTHIPSDLVISIGSKPSINDMMSIICSDINDDNEDDGYGLLHYFGSGKRLRSLNKSLYNKRGKKKGKCSYYDEYDDYWSHRKSMYSDDEWDDSMMDDSYELPYKCIKFYSDINNEFTVRDFYSLKEFNDFCEENGYYVGATDLSNLKNWSIIHCCLDPIDLEYGEKSILTDNSYGGLYWSVSDDISKINAMKESGV